MGRPPVKHYEKKMEYHLVRQDYRCAGCRSPFGNVRKIHDPDGTRFYQVVRGRYGTDMVKLDLCHNYPRTKNAIELYPNFVDSLSNTRVMHNHCNVARRQFYINGKHRRFYTYYQADSWERFLLRHPKMNRFVNLEALDG